MEILSVVQSLCRFETTHEKPEEIQKCLQYCKSLLPNDPKIIVREHISNGHPSLVISNTPDKSFDVILCAHIDTVPGHSKLFEGLVSDGKIWGRGTLDMKAFVGTSLEVFLRSMNVPKLKIAVMIVSDEELGGKFGTSYLLNELGYRCKIVLVPDDGEHISKIVSETKHVLQYRFEAKGQESHACRPWDGKSAIRSLMSFYNKIEPRFVAGEWAPGFRWVNTINPGIFIGGSAVNEVAGKAKMDVDFRLIAGTTKYELENWIQLELTKDISKELLNEAFPLQLDRHHPLVALYLESITRELGSPPDFVKSGGATDARFFSALAIPAIVHQGNGGECQTDDEHVEIESLDRLVRIQTDFLARTNEAFEQR